MYLLDWENLQEQHDNTVVMAAMAAMAVVLGRTARYTKLSVGLAYRE